MYMTLYLREDDQRYRKKNAISVYYTEIIFIIRIVHSNRKNAKKIKEMWCLRCLWDGKEEGLPKPFKQRLSSDIISAAKEASTNIVGAKRILSEISSNNGQFSINLSKAKRKRNTKYALRGKRPSNNLLGYTTSIQTNEEERCHITSILTKVNCKWLSHQLLQ